MCRGLRVSARVVPGPSGVAVRELAAPLLVIEVSVPVRICDLGGWTDTWFGGPGRVVNIAVQPGVAVRLAQSDGPDPVVLVVEGPDARAAGVPGAAERVRHPLLAAALDALTPPDDLRLRVTVRSAVPAGCGAGTSAAVAVAMLAGLAAVRSEHWVPQDLAYAAHRLEVDGLGGQSGIQDQLSAALGGINYLEIDHYPQATVQALPSWEDLGSRLTTVFVGRAHDSSRVHDEVIAHLAGGGSGALDRLREAALAARDAVLHQDLHGLGHAMIANTDGQRALHADLVGADARRVIDLAARDGAIGWKVNGAGGDGGSLTVLHDTSGGREAFERRVIALDHRYAVLPLAPSVDGLVVRGAL